MSQAVKYSPNSKSAPELHVSFKLPVLDCELHSRATRAMGGSVQGSATRRVSMHLEFSVKREGQETSAHSKGESRCPSTASCRMIEDPSVLNGMARGGDPNINASMRRDHGRSGETCATRGRKVWCGCAAQKSQCDRGAEENPLIPGKEIHEAALHDWHVVNPSEGDGYVETDFEIVTHDLAASDLHLKEPVASFERESFEIVDGVVESELVDGRVVNVWKDTMLMEEDCGLQGRMRRLSSWHGLL